MSKPKRPAAMALELGVELAPAAQVEGPKPATCIRCSAEYRPLESNATCPEAFCSKSCERTFVRERLSGLTIDDCRRLQQRLEKLIAAADAKIKLARKTS